MGYIRRDKWNGNQQSQLDPDDTNMNNVQKIVYLYKHVWIQMSQPVTHMI